MPITADESWSRGFAVDRICALNGRLFDGKRTSPVLVEKVLTAIRRRVVDSAAGDLR